MYKYKMVQIPPNVIVNAKKVSKDRAAAVYLENVVNEMAQDGWEFQRIDSIGVQEQLWMWQSVWREADWSSQLLCDYIPPRGVNACVVKHSSDLCLSCDSA